MGGIQYNAGKNMVWLLQEAGQLGKVDFSLQVEFREKAKASLAKNIRITNNSLTTEEIEDKIDKGGSFVSVSSVLFIICCPQGMSVSSVLPSSRRRRQPRNNSRPSRTDMRPSSNWRLPSER